MDGAGYGRAIVNGVIGMMIAVGIACTVLGGLITLGVIYGAPYVWELIKPYIHQVTS